MTRAAHRSPKLRRKSCALAYFTLLVRGSGRVKPVSRDETHFVSAVDLKPTFLEIAGASKPKRLDGRSFAPLLRGKSQPDRQVVFTQIGSKAGGDGVPMRCVQDARYGYIYNPFSDGKHVYRNNNEGRNLQHFCHVDVSIRFRSATLSTDRYPVIR